MCKSKMNTNVKEPTPIPSRRSTRTRRSSSYETSQSTTTELPSTSSFVNTSGNYNTTTSSSSNKNSSTTSISSRNSLKSFRDSLPENAHIYDFSEIRSATNNFLAKRFSTSSSSAWRCLIRGKDVILFQRKFSRSIETSELQQRLSIICRSHHISLIKLLGASISGDYIYLVYEYINGGNLHDCLRNPRNPDFTVLNTWISRMQIATDLAQGIEYIHHYTGLNLSPVHNHIKSSTVIVTEPSFNAKLCHFGTSELCGEINHENHHQNQNQKIKEDHHQIGDIEEIQEIPQEEGKLKISVSESKLKRSNSRNVKFSGTRGYISPEYGSTGIATQKSDVYAFGVVILELLTGEEPIRFKIEKGGEYKSVSIIETGKEAIESKDFERIRRWIDRRLKDSFPVDIAEKITRLALECVDVNPDKRPDMKRVAGKMSKLYLQSKKWTDQMRHQIDLTVSYGPR